VFPDVGQWSIEQNVPTPGLLTVGLAGNVDSAPNAAGMLVEVTFDITAGATAGATSLISLTKAEFNEEAATTVADGTFSVLTLMYGDVTGNGEVTPYDAGWVLEHVAHGLLGADIPFPIEDSAPVWAPFPVTKDVAHEVANVSVVGDPDIAAPDASLILQHAVQLIDTFPVETPATAPVVAPIAVQYTLRAGASSERPGARIVVTLEAAQTEELYAGELLLAYDPDILSPTRVHMHGAGRGAGPMVAHRAEGGQVAIAFASGRPIEAATALLDVAFEATRGISQPTGSAIRASHLRLNRSLIETDFAFAFRIEPFANRLMANYPNPFNPETWIPFELAEAADVTIRVYGLDGGLVRKLDLGARSVGEYVGREDAAYWDGRNAEAERVASGVYVYELTAGDYHALRRMVVMK
jgi:hypothetical protein